MNASIQLRENPSKHIPTSQQHLIIDFLDNYIYQLKQLRKKEFYFLEINFNISFLCCLEIEYPNLILTFFGTSFNGYVFSKP